MSVREARANFAAAISSVEHTGEPVVIERRGKPVVSIVPADEVYGGAPAPRNPELDAQLDAIVADSPALKEIVEMSRKHPARLPRPMTWHEMRDLAREEYVLGKIRKKGLLPRQK